MQIKKSHFVRQRNKCFTATCRSVSVFNKAGGRKMKHTWAVVILGLTMTMGIQAESFRKDQHDQRQRIYRGVRSGELTRPETSRLYRRSADLSRDYARDRRDGNGLSFNERRRLEARQSQLSRSIYRQKHDRQDRNRRY
jgi:hypothetical protein